MRLNITTPIAQPQQQPGEPRQAQARGRERALARAGRGPALPAPAAARVSSRASAGMPSSSAAATSSPRRCPASGPARSSSRAAEGGRSGISSRSRGDSCRVARGRRRPRRVRDRGALARRRLALEPVEAVEHERRVPGAAVARADRERPLAGREGERREQPRERDRDVQRAGAEQLSRRAAARSPAARAPRSARGPAAPPATRRASRRRPRRAPRPRPAARRCSRARPARATHSSASTVSAIITPSIVSLREVITSIGSSASASAAARPAGVLHRRRTAANSSGTAAVPNERLGEQQAGRREAHELDARDLQPEVDRRLVDRDAAARLERPEEEVVPGLRHAPDGRVVEGVQRRAAEVVEAQRPRQQRDRGDGTPGQTRRCAARGVPCPLPAGAGGTRRRAFSVSVVWGAIGGLAGEAASRAGG